ncbi:hypothetical protein BJ912DRAFT_1083699 [Pholiota molesta]|nr:hypothetical protein BJ912DRAFT_1083699 [Pholiota molesta]
MSELYIPVSMDIPKSAIISAFDATVVHVFLMGIYIVIYIGTMYTYVVEMKGQFIGNGGTRNSVFSPLYANPEWLVLASDIAIYIVLILADGLLIWRCFFVWGQSFRVILVPSFLLVVEIGLFLAQPVLRAAYNNSAVSPTLAATFNDLVVTAYFTTFATSLITTALIAYKIYSSSSQTRFSRKLYRHIIDIVVQSGAVYSLTALATAISGVLPGSNIIHTRSICAQNYIQAIGVYVSGLSATIMVARVGLLSAKTVYPSTAHFSGIQFQTPTNKQADVEEGPNNISPDVDKMTFADGEKVASAVTR